MKSKRLEWWHYVVFVFLGLQISFWIIPQRCPGLPGLVCWYFGIDQFLWWGLSGLLLIFAVIFSFRRRPFWNKWRLVGFGLILLVVFSPMIFRVYPSSYDNKPSLVPFRIPFDGPITVVWGGATPDKNYHVFVPNQRWAYDFLVTKDGSSHQNGGSSLEDYYIYGRPILSPADGVVRDVYTEASDMPAGQLGGDPPTGNHVILEVSEKQYLFLCHMKPGSITVKSGDHVHRGEIIGMVGNSGNTSEPHLHIHLQDTPLFFFGEGIPLNFYHYRVGDRLVEKGMPTGGVQREKFIGEIIEHAGE